MPSPGEPEMIDCVVCDGLDPDCEACEGTGLEVISHCPKRLVDGQVKGLLDLVAHAEEGLMPCGGGVGDQTDWFLRGLDAVRKEHRLVDREEKTEK